MLKPRHTEPIKPECCPCGNTDFPETQPYYTHQYIELSEIQMQVIHFVLHRGQCPCCGKTVKATLANAYRTGFGPRRSATVSVSANYGLYRKWVGLQQTCMVHLIRKARDLRKNRSGIGPVRQGNRM